MTSADLSFYRSSVFEEARAQAYVEGLAKAARQNILVVFEVRGMHVTEAVRERITGCDDPEVLRQWHRRAVVGVAEDVFVGG